MPRIYREGVKTTKTMIYLEEEIHKQLRHMSVDERVSMSELIRRAVDEFLSKKGVGKKRGSKK
jgi:hypothetical protein